MLPSPLKKTSYSNPAFGGEDDASEATENSVEEKSQNVVDPSRLQGLEIFLIFISIKLLVR
jgi:hypothetical protein